MLDLNWFWRNRYTLSISKRSRVVTGREAENLLDEVGITVSKNTIPFETESPFVTSGIRLGTPALTTRRLERGGNVRDCRVN